MSLILSVLLTANLAAETVAERRFSRVDGNGNTPRAVFAEIKGIIGKQWLNVPIQVSIDTKLENSPRLNISYQREDDAPVVQKLMEYAESRFSGHSAAYAAYLQKDRQSEWKTGHDKYKHYIPMLSKEVALPWIRRGLDSAVFPGSRDDPRWASLWVVDGELAWRFDIPLWKQSDDLIPVTPWRLDAAEFSAATRKKFLKHYESIKQKHARPEGFSVSMWYELSAALKKDGVKWRTPMTLNPETMFD